MAYRFVEAPVWKDYIIAPTVDLLNMTTDALDEFIRNTGSSSGHIVSTTAMSAKDASYGVASLSLLWICPKSLPGLCLYVVQVNPDLLVKGASGLSIIDASIMVGEKSLFPVLIKTDHIEAFHSQCSHPGSNVCGRRTGGGLGQRAVDIISTIIYAPKINED